MFSAIKPLDPVIMSMKITKLGHCCLRIETRGKVILTDPGSFTIEAQSKQIGIDCVLYTHEHADHYHLESLKAIIANNPRALIYANSSVSTLLEKENIPHALVKNGDSLWLGEIELSGIGEKHAIIHSSLPEMANTGYMIDGRLWYPGDSFTDPKRPVEILALPVAGPWMKISEAIDYAIALKPKVALPVHDAVRLGTLHAMLGRIFSGFGIAFEAFAEGESKEF